jgi:hypothetical protein
MRVGGRGRRRSGELWLFGGGGGGWLLLYGGLWALMMLRRDAGRVGRGRGRTLWWVYFVVESVEFVCCVCFEEL